MTALIDLVGQRFGRLVVLARADRGSQKQVRWRCLCDCGNEVMVDAANLRGGITKSCGCLSRETTAKRFRKAPGVSASHKLLNQYKNGADRRGLTFCLTDEEALTLFQGDCEYCGAEPQAEIRTTLGYSGFVHNGIDRIDSSIGYTVDNCVPCCKTCNLAKHTLTVAEFLAWANRVVEHNR